MSLPVFLGDTTAGVGERVRLTGPEGHHAVRVRRLTVGERLAIADGTGRLLECVVVGLAGAELTAEVQAVVTAPRPVPTITVVQALPKGERAEAAVTLMTEVGVDTIVPWQAERCVVQWRGDKAERGRQRWQAAAREAAKQSRRIWHPQVTEPADTAAVAARCAAADRAVLLHESATEPLTDLSLADVTDLVLVVGPEGGLTDAELQILGAAGAGPFRLGPEVLRTSSAGAVAAAVLASRTRRWAVAP